MSAREMFEELGYKEIKLADEGLVALYEKIIFGDRQSIHFYPEKTVRIIFHIFLHLKHGHTIYLVLIIVFYFGFLSINSY